MKKVVALMMALLMLIAGMAHSALADSFYAPLEADAETLAAANLFLSNFTEIGMQSISDDSYDMELVDFAHDHMWFNDHKEFEFGEYFGGNNCRVADDDIQRIVNKYFYDPREVDLSQTRFDYADGYYYHCETGGFMPCGFAHTVSICPIGESKYFVAFMMFGGGEIWDNSVMDDTLAEIEAAFGHPCGYGSALIYAEDLSDRSTYRMISYAVV